DPRFSPPAHTSSLLSQGLGHVHGPQVLLACRTGRNGLGCGAAADIHRDLRHMSDRFQQLLNSRPFLMADGATVTNLFAAGLMTGDAPEMWNFAHPEKIEALHQSFVDAGADLFLTNSFGGTSYRLKLHNAQDKVREINREAARIGRRIADKAKQEKGRDVIVAGSMGPTGELYEPLGPLTIEDGAAAFAEQARALAEGGVDALWTETLSCKGEVNGAVQG